MTATPRDKNGMTALTKYMTEGQLAESIVGIAMLYNWRVVHFRPARTEKGWRTAMTGHVGFPDLVLARGGVVLHAELKREDGRLGRGQAEWAKELGDSYRLWRPSDLEAIKEELR